MSRRIKNIENSSNLLSVCNKHGIDKNALKSCIEDKSIALTSTILKINESHGIRNWSQISTYLDSLILTNLNSNEEVRNLLSFQVNN